jgi:hypothetical protein
MRTVRLVTAIAALFSLTGCSGEPQTSYCEALCDWAVECNAADRDVDADALRAECIAATQAVDGSCADASKGLGPADAKLTTDCTDAISAKQNAGECTAFTGRYDDMAQETTPKECASQGASAQETFEAARDSTAESNDEMCERFADTFCQATDECVRAELGSEVDAIIEAVGYSPYDSCREKTNSNTQECLSESQYELGESITDPNAQREFARECLGDFSAVTCDQLLGGQLPEECAGALEDPTAYTGALAGVLTEFVPSGD